PVMLRPPATPMRPRDRRRAEARSLTRGDRRNVASPTVLTFPFRSSSEGAADSDDAPASGNADAAEGTPSRRS
ncbi:MAG: hypothetical protein ACRD96_04900, partial [Bryobacteraceae bacterium]